MLPSDPKVDHPYNEIFLAVVKWAKDGILDDFNGLIDEEKFCDLDEYLLKKLGYLKGPQDLSTHRWLRNAINALQHDIKNNRVNFDWIVGSHGYALFKTYRAQRCTDE